MSTLGDKGQPVTGLQIECLPAKLTSMEPGRHGHLRPPHCHALRRLQTHSPSPHPHPGLGGLRIRVGENLPVMAASHL